MSEVENELENLRTALAYAIGEADYWYNENNGLGEIKTPEMDAARKLLDGGKPRST